MKDGDANRPRRRGWHAIALLLLLTLLWATPSLALPPRAGFQTWSPRSFAATAIAPGLGGFVHKLQTRADRSLGRLSGVLWDVSTMWFWVLWSSGLFLLVSAVSSVVDIRMLALRHEGPAALSRDLSHGMRTFFRLLLDRRPPYLPRLVLFVALIYWLMPIDLIPDTSFLPGFADDFVIAIIAAKTFMYLCPDALVQGHAEAVEAEARA